LHLEFGPFQPPKVRRDAVVLAGGIHARWKALPWIWEHFKDCPVLYVLGNHEFYGANLGRLLEEVRGIVQSDRVHILECDEVVFDGVRFLGTTNWTDYEVTGNPRQAMDSAETYLNDHRKIRVGDDNRRLRAADLLERNRRCSAWLSEALNRPFHGKTVVITHHAPSALSIPRRFRNSDLNGAFASDLEWLMGGNCDLWIHGHVHDSFDYGVHGTRVVCNPRGYTPHELNEQFQPGLVIEI
jgi:Icc-related predicted phosphoesterase